MQILATSLHADDDDDDDGVGPWLFGLCILQSKRVAPRASARRSRRNSVQLQLKQAETKRYHMYICDVDDDGPRAS